jgi:nitrous-oxide reductase
MKKIFLPTLLLIATFILLGTSGCKPKNAGDATGSDAAARVYVPPGKYDELYNFVSGGFSGQVSV